MTTRFLSTDAARAQTGARRAHDVAVALCAEACASRTIEDAARDLERLASAARASCAAARARAETRRGAREASERALRDAQKAHDAAKELLNEEFKRVRARGEAVLARLESSTVAEAWTARRRAADLCDFADALECVIAFAQGSASIKTACGGLFVDKMRKGDAGRLAKRAQEIVGMVRASFVTKADTVGTERILSDASMALEKYCENVENDLLDQFSDALSKKSYSASKAHAEALFSINGGASVLARYVASREMFMSTLAIEEAQGVRIAIEQSLSDGAAASVCIDRVSRYFKEIRAALRRDFQTSMKAAFDSRSTEVLNAFVHRIVEERIGTVIEAFLTAEIRTPDALHHRLSLTALTLREIGMLNSTICELTNNDERASVIDPDEFFGIGGESLLLDECACLDSIPSDDEVLPSNLSMESGDLAIESLCQRYKDSVRRVEMYLPAISVGSAQMRVSQTFIERVARLSRGLVREAIAQTNGASARFTASTSCEEARATVFDPVLRASARVNKWMRSGRDGIAAAGLSSGVVNQLVSMTQRELAHDLEQVFEITSTRALALLDAKFRGLQKPSDYVSLTGGETSACVAVIEVLHGLKKSASECFAESANANSLVNEISERFYSLLFMHVCRFKYTMIGGMQLKLDLSAFVQWTRAAAVNKVCVARYETLSHRANLLVVSSEEVEGLVRELELESTIGGSSAEIDMIRKLRAGE